MMDCGSQTNPYQLAAVSWGDLRVNANIVDYMNGYGDPRMSKYFNHSTFTGHTQEYVGMRPGEDGFAKSDVAGYSIPAITELQSYWYSALLKQHSPCGRQTEELGLSAINRLKSTMKKESNLHGTRWHNNA